MSRQNKINPGMYTQRGRLTQDDAARELKRQRVIGSHNTWQPVQRDRKPALTAEPDGSEANEAAAETPTTVQTRPVRAKAAKKARPIAAKAARPSKPSAAPKSKRPAKTAARTATGGKKAKTTTAPKRRQAGRAKKAKAATSKATRVRRSG